MNPHDSQKSATDTPPLLPSPMVSIESGYTPEAAFRSSISAEIPETVTSGKDCNCTEPKDGLADVSNSSDENCIIRTNEQGEIGVIHLIVIGVGCVTLLVVTAVLKGIDGVLLSTGIAGIVALISGFSGYKIGQKSVKK